MRSTWKTLLPCCPYPDSHLLYSRVIISSSFFVLFSFCCRRRLCRRCSRRRRHRRCRCWSCWICCYCYYLHAKMPFLELLMKIVKCYGIQEYTIHNVPFHNHSTNGWPIIFYYTTSSNYHKADIWRTHGTKAAPMLLCLGFWQLVYSIQFVCAWNKNAESMLQF